MPHVELARECPAPSIDHAARRPGLIIVAADGRHGAGGAMAVAHLLAQRGRGSVEMVSVLEPVNDILPPMTPDAAPSHPGAARVADRHVRLREMEVRALGAGPGWPTDLLLGEVVPSIVQIARERGARLIITGRVPHGFIERSMRRETPLALVRAASIPVLAVPEHTTRLPRCVVVAVGIGQASALSEPSAHGLLDDAVAIHLVHVRPRTAPEFIPENREDSLVEEDEIQAAFTAAKAQWSLPADVSIETHELVGRPVAALLAFAKTVDADLLVVGRALQSRPAFLPSQDLATLLYRHTTIAMLIVPVERHVTSSAGETSAVSITFD